MGGEKVSEKSRSGQPFLLFLFLVHEGTNCLQPPQPLVVEGWEMGKAKPVSLGGPIFSQQPGAGQHCGVDSALAGLGIVLTPRSLCEVLGLNPTIPSSIPLL